MFRSLNFLSLPAGAWTSAESKRNVESFVLQGLDVIPRTAGIPALFVAGEDCVVMIIDTLMSPLKYDPAFCAAVLRKWRSAAVRNVLRARGALQTGIGSFEQNDAEFDARERDDIAKHGLRDCALPSCYKLETTVKEFGCSGCWSVVYCCLEHQALDWRAHKKACCEKEAAQRAAEDAAEEARATEEEIAFNLGLD